MRRGRSTGLKGTGVAAARTQARRPPRLGPRRRAPRATGAGCSRFRRLPALLSAPAEGSREAARRCGRAGRLGPALLGGAAEAAAAPRSGPRNRPLRPRITGSGPRGAPSAAVPLPAARALVPRRVAVRSRALVLVYFRAVGRRVALREGVPGSGSGAALCAAGTLTAAGVRGFCFRYRTSG